MWTFKFNAEQSDHMPELTKFLEIFKDRHCMLQNGCYSSFRFPKFACRD